MQRLPFWGRPVEYYRVDFCNEWRKRLWPGAAVEKNSDVVQAANLISVLCSITAVYNSAEVRIFVQQEIY